MLLLPISCFYTYIKKEKSLKKLLKKERFYLITQLFIADISPLRSAFKFSLEFQSSRAQMLQLHYVITVQSWKQRYCVWKKFLSVFIYNFYRTWMHSVIRLQFCFMYVDTFKNQSKRKSATENLHYKVTVGDSLTEYLSTASVLCYQIDHPLRLHHLKI